MNSKISNIVLLLIGIIFYNVESYSSGPGACIQPAPSMPTTPVDGTNGGYTVLGLPTAYVPNAVYSINITGGSNTFKGFILYAEGTGSSRFGTWTPAAGGRTQNPPTLGCSGGLTATIGHTSTLAGTPQSNLNIGTWTAPSSDVGDLTFKGVCVQVKMSWWFFTPVTISADILTTGFITAVGVITAVADLTTGVTTAAVPLTTGLTTGVGATTSAPVNDDDDSATMRTYSFTIVFMIFSVMFVFFNWN